MINIRNQVREIINKSLSYNSIDESVNLKTDLVTHQLDTCFNDFQTLFTLTISNLCLNNSNITPQQLHIIHQSSTGSNLEAAAAIQAQDNQELLLRKEATQELVAQVFYQKHTKKQLILLRLITRLVNQRIVEVRYVCESMLANLVFSNSSDGNANYLNILNSSTNFINATQTASNNFGTIQKLTQTQQHNQQQPQQQRTHGHDLLKMATPTYLWCKILECVRRFIPLHDYKSCRDIFKMLLEVVKRIPHSHGAYPVQLETELSFIKPAALLMSKHKLLSDYTSGDNSLTEDDTNSAVSGAKNSQQQQIQQQQESIITDDLK
jgi:hypothetical protein